MAGRFAAGASHSDLAGEYGYIGQIVDRDAPTRGRFSVWECPHVHRTRSAAVRCAQEQIDAGFPDRGRDGRSRTRLVFLRQQGGHEPTYVVTRSDGPPLGPFPTRGDAARALAKGRSRARHRAVGGYHSHTSHPYSHPRSTKHRRG